MGDLTTNHTGDDHAWFRTALSDPTSVERGFYRFDGERYESWLGVPSLPKLDHASRELAERLYAGPDSIAARWLRRGLDGWRIDVANMTGRMGADDLTHDVARRCGAPSPRSGRTDGCWPSTATTRPSTSTATAGTARWTTPASPGRCGAG